MYCFILKTSSNIAYFCTSFEQTLHIYCGSLVLSKSNYYKGICVVKKKKKKSQRRHLIQKATKILSKDILWSSCVRPNIENMFAGNCIPIIQNAKHGIKLILVLKSLMTPFILLVLWWIFFVQSLHGYLSELYTFAIELASRPYSICCTWCNE